VEPLEGLSSAETTLWVKRDDLACEPYGGNKVRKLELLLGEARDRGKRRILTVGAAGSHQVVATAIYGAREGFAVEAVLVPQPPSAHAKENLRVALAHGLRAFASPAWTIAPFFVAAHLRRDAYFIPLGGSNVLGSLGFVDAAHELAAQVRAGELAEPDLVVVAMGSGGTVAGLAAGFEQTGMKTRVLGVAVSPPAPALALVARRLARKTAEAAGLPPHAAARAAGRIDVDASFIGQGYGHPTPAGSDAYDAAAHAGLSVDATYTAKAFACALAAVRAGRSRDILFWQTLSRAPSEHLPRVSELPPDLERLFR